MRPAPRISKSGTDMFQRHGSWYWRDKVSVLVGTTSLFVKDTDLSSLVTTSKNLRRKLNAITTISSAAESLLHTTKPSRPNCCKFSAEYASSQTLALQQLSDFNSFMSIMTNHRTKQPRLVHQPLNLYLSTISPRCLR